MKKPVQLMSACAAASLLLFTGAAMAADGSDAQQRYRDERAACMNGASNQDRATCLREAGAALQESRRNGLAHGTTRELGANRMQRCDALPDQDRGDCQMRMNGQGSTSGSVMGGGMMRELERPVPAPATH